MSKHDFKVLLTNPISESEHQRLAKYAEVVVAPDATPDTLRELIADADGLIVRTKLPDDIFDYQTHLKCVVRHGVGLDMIPMQQATLKKIPVANIPGSNTASVVEYCLNSMLYFVRNLGELQLHPPGVQWDLIRSRANTTQELAGSILGIVGVGAIGGALAAVGQALGMRVIGLTRRKESLPSGVDFADKQSLFSNADFVVLSCPLTPDTVGFVDAGTIALMKRSAVLINVSRGPVVQTEALLHALKDKRLRGAALDVHNVQPISADMYPGELDNLLLTPHVAGITISSMAKMSAGAVDEMLRVVHGELFLNLVNPDIYK